MVTQQSDYTFTQKEPLVALGTALSGVVAAVIVVLRSFGIDLDPAQETSLNGLINALVIVGPFVFALISRFFVVSPATAAKTVNEAYFAVPGVDSKPTIKVPGMTDDQTRTAPAGSVIQ